MDEFISKPFRLEQLQSILSKQTHRAPPTEHSLKKGEAA